MTITQAILKFIAARFHVPAETLDYFWASAQVGRPAETALPFPAELIPIGARLVMRGWHNHAFFPTNRDWILPYWAERQFDPSNPAFLPYGLNLYTFNYTHRDWTMIGNPTRAREAIVDPRGLVTPWFDGWSLDVWLALEDHLYAPSRLADAEIEQSLYENLPIVVTTFRAGAMRVRRQVCAIEHAATEFVVEQTTVENPSPVPHRATLYLAVRPLNPEGVGLVKRIELEEGTPQSAWIINRALGVVLPKPDAVACSNFENGDVALALPQLNGKTKIECAAGLATAVAAYRIALDAGARKTITVWMPMHPEQRDEDENSTFPIPTLPSDWREQTIALWREQTARGMRVRLPDEKLDAAFQANKAYLLLLHDGDTITPGPWMYHQFWFRDAAYLLNALDKLGYHAEARQVIEQFPRRLQKDGYLAATEGEWDSNGAALWTMVEHARLTGDRELLARHYWSMLRMASWINSKRRKTALASPHHRSPHTGLLPPGPSAEHLGPSDYFYWDDFWGLAGLRAMAQVAEWLAQPNDAKKLRANYESFRAAVDASLAHVAQRLGRAAMPASPYRRLDAGMIGNLVALYPLRLFDAHDPRIVDTIAALKEKAWLEEAYFNHVGHSTFGTYLSLHVAQCLLMQRHHDAWKIIRWVVRHASPTWTWAEGIHPRTRAGGMGDGHHGWALADFLLIVRNLLLLEEHDHLLITPILPADWTTPMNVIKVENAPTYFGNVSYTIAFGERTATLVVKGTWRDESLNYIEWCLPFTLREFGSDEEVPGIAMVGNTLRLPRGVRRVVVRW